MRSRSHDQGIRLVEIELAAALVGGFKKLEEFVTGEPGEIVEGRDLILAQRYQHTRRQLIERGEFVGDPQLAAPLLIFAIAPFERYTGALLQLCSHISIKSFDVGEIFEWHIRH